MNLVDCAKIKKRRKIIAWLWKAAENMSHWRDIKQVKGPSPRKCGVDGTSSTAKLLVLFSR